MKARNSIFAVAFATATLMGSAYAASTYVSNFESWSIVDMDGVDGWISSDPTPEVGMIFNQGGAFGNRSGSIGFVAPLENNNAYVHQGVTTPLVGTQMPTSFSVLFTVHDSDSGYGAGSENRDKFGFRLENAVGDNLFSFMLTPSAQVGDPENSDEYNAFSWSQGATSTVVLAPLKAQEGYGYTFSVEFHPSGANDVSFIADVNGSGFSGTLTGVQSEIITEFGAVWETFAGKTAPGSNFMVFDNISMVPEPSSALLGLLGTSLAFVRRRRA